MSSSGSAHPKRRIILHFVLNPMLGVVLGLCLGQSAVDAADYTVKADGSGNFTTIQACANAVTAGNTCVVYAGVYNEHVKTISGGIGDNNRVTFRAQGLVTMQGFDIKHPYVTVDGFDMTGYYVGSYVGLVDIWQDADYAVVINNTMRENDGSTKVYGIKFERVSGDSANNAVIRNNTMARLNAQYFMLSGNSHLIEQNTMSEARQWDAFYAFGIGHVIRRNIFWNAGAAGGGNHPDFVQTFSASGQPAQDMLFEENWIQNIPDQFCQFNSSVDGVGALVSNVKNFTFRRNVIANVPGNCNLDIPGTRWENNTFYQMGSSLSGIILGGSLTRGDAPDTTFRNNVFLGGGSNPTSTSDANGFYTVDGFLFTREVIASYVTKESINCPSACPIAAAITDEMISNGYIDGAFNGHILAPARSLSTINDMKLSGTYAAYKQALWDRLQESITHDNAMKSTFSADYNYVAGSPSAGYPAKKSSGCNCSLKVTSGNFCEAVCGHGINGGDPKLANLSNLLGPDGVPFTIDDGLKPTAMSPLCGKGEGGIDIGAYSCAQNRVFSVDSGLLPPPAVSGVFK